VSLEVAAPRIQINSPADGTPVPSRTFMVYGQYRPTFGLRFVLLHRQGKTILAPGITGVGAFAGWQSALGKASRILTHSQAADRWPDFSTGTLTPRHSSSPRASLAGTRKVAHIWSGGAFGRMSQVVRPRCCDPLAVASQAEVTRGLMSSEVARYCECWTDIHSQKTARILGAG
jgi:hypothetical protein